MSDRIQIDNIGLAEGEQRCPKCNCVPGYRLTSSKGGTFYEVSCLCASSGEKETLDEAMSEWEKKVSHE